MGVLKCYQFVLNIVFGIHSIRNNILQHRLFNIVCIVYKNMHTSIHKGIIFSLLYNIYRIVVVSDIIRKEMI